MLDIVQCYQLSHYFFAYDSFFFLRATKENCGFMKGILDVYCAASAQEANLEKFGVFYSANAFADIQRVVCDSLGITENKSPGSYLGLPAMWERSKTSALAFVKDRVEKKIQGWKGCLLSQAGKEVMTKAVVNAISAYSMICFKFSKKTCMELDALVSNFWCSQGNKGGKMHWLFWKK